MVHDLLRSRESERRTVKQQTARMVFFFVPAGTEAMFEKMAADPENYISIGREYGVEFVDEA